MLALVVETLLKIAVLAGGLLTAAAYLVLLERRVAAWVQDRIGPNRVGIPLTRIRIWGLGQPIADGGKFIFKEEFTPAHVDKPLYFAGPIIMFSAAMLLYAVVPFGRADLGIEGVGPIDLVVVGGLDIGMVFVLAAGSLAVYGVLLGSWASNNKYSFFGGLRSAAQLIAYEIPLGLGVLGVVLASGSLRLDEMILQQARSGWWNALVQPLGLLVFMIAAMAEAGRLPFDLPEAEQELVGGYHTEYSGMKLMMYLVSEFLHMVAAAVLIVMLFLGGWHFWGLTGAEATAWWPWALLRVGVLLLKVLAVILLFMLMRWSWPRFRFDQLMNVAWKAMLPLGLVNVVAVAVWHEYGAAWAAACCVPAGVVAFLWGWAVLIGAWLAVTLLAPLSADNRPRRPWSEAGQGSREAVRP